jgi:hypothetical protein
MIRWMRVAPLLLAALGCASVEPEAPTLISYFVKARVADGPGRSVVLRGREYYSKGGVVTTGVAAAPEPASLDVFRDIAAALVELGAASPAWTGNIHGPRADLGSALQLFKAYGIPAVEAEFTDQKGRADATRTLRREEVWGYRARLFSIRARTGSGELEYVFPVAGPSSLSFKSSSAEEVVRFADFWVRVRDGRP